MALQTAIGICSSVGTFLDAQEQRENIFHRRLALAVSNRVAAVVAGSFEKVNDTANHESVALLAFRL